jgi:thioredoxin-related protein
VHRWGSSVAYILVANQPSGNTRLYKFLAGLLLIGAPAQSFATTKTALPEEILPVLETRKLSGQQIENEEMSVTDKKKNVIQGTVFDSETKETVPFATVFIQDTKTGVFTDMEGKFELIIPDSLLSDKLTLVVQYVGYESTKFKIYRNQLPLSKELFITRALFHLMGDITIIKQKKKKWWQRIF